MAFLVALGVTGFALAPLGWVLALVITFYLLVSYYGLGLFRSVIALLVMEGALVALAMVL